MSSFMTNNSSNLCIPYSISVTSYLVCVETYDLKTKNLLPCYIYFKVKCYSVNNKC